MIYRKVHLYDAFGFKESDKFEPGSTVSPPVTSGECRFGVMICYDVRFPEMARMLALEGSNVLVVPAGWVQGDLKSGSLANHDQSTSARKWLLRHCSRSDREHLYRPQHGRRPIGPNIVDLGEREGLEVVELNLALVLETREKLPLLQNRRADVYARSPNAKLP